jgi:hypothetical protein
MYENEYVIAGNFRQFIHYFKKHPKYKYIQSKVNLYGLHKPIVHLAGTYYERKDWFELLDILKAENATLLEGVKDGSKS